MLTLDQFRATGRDTADIGAAIGDEMLSGRPGRLYADSLYIEREGGGFMLTLGNWSETLPLPELEAELYDWAKAEGWLDSYRFDQLLSEFPDYPCGSLPDIPATWASRAWRNEAAPMFEAARHFVMVDYPGAPQREVASGPRFYVYAADDDADNGMQIGECVLETDDFAAVLALTESGK